jgi:two-component system response regulator RegA
MMAPIDGRYAYLSNAVEKARDRESGGDGAFDESECEAIKNLARVLIIDDNESFSRCLAGEFCRLRLESWTAKDLVTASTIARTRDPRLVISELKVGAKPTFPLLQELPADGRLVVVATSYPSVATAVRAVRLGVKAYVAKPASAARILGAALEPVDCPANGSGGAEDWPSLDRTIWEYLNQVLVVAGSMSAAARRLGLDRRSLRRMLSKYPPPR